MLLFYPTASAGAIGTWVEHPTFNLVDNLRAGCYERAISFEKDGSKCGKA